MNKNFLIVFVLLLFAATSHAQTIKGELLADSGNLKVVRVWGNHYERGYAYGYLCEPYIMSVWEDYIYPNYSTVLPFARAIVGNTSNFHIDNIFIDEAQGIIDGLGAAGADTSGLSYLDLFVVNFMTDLEGFMPKAGFKTHECSSMMNWGDATLGTDLNGKSVIAHHLDAIGYDSILVHNQVMVIHIPSESNEQPWLLTGIAGQMVASQAVNKSGIAAFINTVNNFSAQAGMGYEPMTLTLRRSIEVLDYNGDGLNNTNDVRAAITSNTNGYARGFIVCALAPSTCIYDTLISMVAEIAPAAPYVTFRHTADSDSLHGDNLYAANEMIKRNNAQDYSARYVQVSGAVNGDYNGVGIGAQDNWDIMKMHSTQSSNLQFIQVIPELNFFQISVSDAGQPGYHFAPTAFDLNELFDYSGGTDPSIADHGVSIFPNPACDFINFRIPGEQFPATFQIFDLVGRQIDAGVTDAEGQANITAIESGLYLIRICGANHCYTIKLTKQ